MIRNPIAVASRVSPELSALIERLADDPDATQPVTLASVRMFLAGMLSGDFKEAERLHHFDAGVSLLDELDELIEEFGDDVLAIELARDTAGEALSRVIEAVMNDDSRDNPPTLGTVRDALVSGTAAELVGAGELEDDESEPLLEEIDGLIERFGVDALAERFICYE
jgi:hypothetical protein